jgi:GntR family transcriptional regulator, carbon starvation induced regulator
MKRAIIKAPLQPDAEAAGAPKTIAESVYRRFRQDILWGKFEPGAPLRSEQLKKTYDVGISPLREALSRLASEQLVTLTAQRGFRVATLTIEDVLDTMETRIVIESEALSRSIGQGDVAWETGIVSSFHTLSRLELPQGPGDEAETWAKHHRAFHMALLAGCRSRWLYHLAGSLFDQAERHRFLLAVKEPDGDMARDTNTEHRRIMEAAIAGKAKVALAALDYHYRTTAESVVEILSSRAGSAAPEVARLKYV